MGRTLAHRGADGRRTITRGSLGLGHARMRVNAEDGYEAQPIEDGALLLAADLRLDNREALAAQLGELRRSGPEGLAAYLRNVRLGLFSKAQQIFLEAKR